MPSIKKLRCKNNKIRDKEDTMKKQFLIFASAIICLLAACSTANFAYYDDIYSSSGEKSAKTLKPAAAQTANNNATVEADSIIYETDENGNLLRTLTYYPGSTEPVITTYMEVADEQESTAPAYASGGSSYTYDPDDYYDYYYSSRIRRFHNNYYTGWGYYDPYFTNMYWYDYYPSSWGLSIYMGYNWWWPSYCYRPYYYSPYWYDYGFHYGWGWHYPYHNLAYIDPWYHYHHHGCDPIDYYHNHHDQNHSYYFGHRNNIGPSVGNGNGRGELPEDNHHGGMAGGGYGNGETNNHYSVTSTPTSFNQRYEGLANGATGSGSSFNNGGSTSATATPIVSGARTDAKPAIQPTIHNDQPTNTGVSAPANNVNTSRSESAAANVSVAKPASTNNPTTHVTSSRTNTTTTSKPSSTVTRTVVTPSRVVTRPATPTRPTTTTRPASSSPTYSNPRNYDTPSTPSTNRPSTYSNPSYNRPATTGSPRSNSTPSHYNTPSSNSRPSYSTPSSNNSRPNYSSPSRSSYSSPSSSSSSSGRSSYSSSSSSSHSSSSSSSHSGRR